MVFENLFEKSYPKVLLERFMILERFSVWQEPRIEMHAKNTHVPYSMRPSAKNSSTASLLRKTFLMFTEEGMMQKSISAKMHLVYFFCCCFGKL